MKHKQFTLLILICMIMTCPYLNAQGVIFNKKDGTTVGVPYQKLDSLVTYDTDPDDDTVGGVKIYKNDGEVVTIPYAELENMQVTPEAIRTPLPPKYFTVAGVQFKMVPVEGGRFIYGTLHSGNANIEELKTNRSSVITLSTYYISETEVSRALYDAVMGRGYNPSTDEWLNGIANSQGDWYDIEQFFRYLNSYTHEKFRLPTNAEWEFAARGGNMSHGYTYSGSNNWNDVAWTNPNSYIKKKMPNELGIYDMSGNYWEWVSDDKSYPAGELYNPFSELPQSYINSNIRYKRGGDYSNPQSVTYSRMETTGAVKIGIRLVLPIQ